MTQGVPRELAEDVLTSFAKMEPFFSGQMSANEFEEAIKPLFKAMADDIAKQKKRLGGDFAVAHAVPTFNCREFIRSLMGPDLVFIVLNMTQECQKERIFQRHGDTVGDMMSSLHKMYEAAKDGEENAYNVTIDQGMSREDVMKEVLKIVETA